MSRSKLLIGAHMSIEGGLEKSIERGASINCTAIQIFISNNRQWHIKTLNKDAIDLFIQTKNKYNMLVVSHASYLINLGSENEETIDKSIKSLETHLNNCDQLEIPYLILHPGSGTKPADAAIKKIGDNLNKILNKYSGSTMILLEVMAGQGSSVGSTFEQLQQIRSYIDKPIGFCFDTCHAWASGYDLKNNYEQVWKHFDEILGIKNLKVFHINDSKKELGSHVDRHENINQGTMSLKPFKDIMNDKRFFNVPKILETPNDTLEGYKKNIEILEELITEENKSKLIIPA